jgi:hypothetical protein
VNSGQRTHEVRRFPARALPAALLAAAMVLTVRIAVLAALVHEQWSLLGSLRVWLVFLTLISVTQWLGLGAWAALTGALFILGLRSRPVRSSSLAALCGVLIPIGLGFLAYAEGAIWPALRATQGPLDRPLLTLPLALYCLAAPLGLGCLAAAPHRSEAP